MDEPDPCYCPMFHRTAEIVGRRWNAVILRRLLAGPARFVEIREAIPGLSDRLLAVRLEELEAEGLVTHVLVGHHAGYALTPKGSALRAVFDAMATYVAEWAEPPG
jgi:DNA-binding HxlR family transcriptional regulator